MTVGVGADPALNTHFVRPLRWAFRRVIRCFSPAPGAVRALRRCLMGLMLLAPTAAHATVVMDCGSLVSADALIEPWEETTRTFGRGSIRVAVVDLGEPACCPQHFIVLSPANMYGGRICALVARNALVPNGWTHVGLDEAVSDRPEGGGLRITVPVYGYDPRTGTADPDSRRDISVLVRQAAGTVDLVASD